MKKQVYAMIALVAIAITAQTEAVIKRRTRKSPASSVKVQVDILKDIVKQAHVTINSNNAKERTAAKRQLTRLTNQLSADVKTLVSEHINTIKLADKSDKATEDAEIAYEKLIVAVNEINAKAEVVMITEDGQEAIERAPEGMKSAVARQEMGKISDAEARATEASLLNRAMAGAKAAVHMPGDYLFGKEQSETKTYFNMAAAAVLAGGAALAAYQMVPEGTGAAISSRMTSAKIRGKELMGRPLTWSEASHKRAVRDTAVRQEIATQQAQDRAKISEYFRPTPTWTQSASDYAQSWTDWISNKANKIMGRDNNNEYWRSVSDRANNQLFE